jgi:hypothetical protein
LSIGPNKPVLKIDPPAEWMPPRFGLYNLDQSIQRLSTVTIPFKYKMTSFAGKKTGLVIENSGSLIML